MASDDTQAITARLPGRLYERLRRAAYLRRVPMNFIVIEALEAHPDLPACQCPAGMKFHAVNCPVLPGALMEGTQR